LERYKSRKELKAEVKEVLRGRWKEAILLSAIPIILTIIGVAITLLSYSFIQQRIGLFSDIGTNINRYESSYTEDFWSTIFGALSTFIAIGISYTFLDWLRNPTMRIEPVKQAFQIFTKKYFLGTFLIYIFTGFFTLLWAFLFIVPGIIKTISYSQAYFIYKDQKILTENGKVSALDCITESRKMMDGHKWEYFVLQLSFIGWGILSILSLGIGFLWLKPYVYCIYAAFYNNLTENSHFDESLDDF
jgi:uncharacterized membrane protein